MTDKRQFVMGIDVGSTAVKVIVMSEQGAIQASCSVTYGANSPRSGWVEQDPDVWWNAAAACIQDCLKTIDPGQIAAISFSGHMSAAILIDTDGAPVMPSIMIADTRSREQTDMLRSQFLDRFVDMTGNEPLDAFTVSKLLWIQSHCPEKLKRASTLLFPKDYIRFKLTGKLGTDPSDAGNSLLYHYTDGTWDKEIVHELGLNPDLLPEIFQSSDSFASVSREAAAQTGLLEGTLIITGAADMACSQLGTGAFRAGTLAVTLSTSAQVVLKVPAIAPELSGKITFHPSAVSGQLYAMGTVFTGGLGVEWGYKLLTGKSKLDADDFAAIGKWSERMKDISPGSDGLLFLPFLTGSASPYFDSLDRASWLGLSTGQSPELLLHSVMEGVAFNIRESMEWFERDGHAIDCIHLGGGGSKNDLWCQMISDVLGKDTRRLAERDASAIGAAILAGVGAGLFTSVEEAIEKTVRTEAAFSCRADRHERYSLLYEQYGKIYQALNEYYHAVRRLI